MTKRSLKRALLPVKHPEGKIAYTTTQTEIRNLVRAGIAKAYGAGSKGIEGAILQAAPAAEPRSLPKRPELTQLQEIVLDTLSDLLLYGGNAGHFNLMLQAAVSHYWRRYVAGRPGRDLTENELREITSFVKDHFSDWKARLQRTFLAEPEHKEPEPETQTIAERVRANFRGTLCTALDEFVDEASPEEKWLMLDVLTTWRSNTNAAYFEHPDVELANAFAIQIDSENRYVRVPDKHREMVYKYLELLETGCYSAKKTDQAA